MEKINHFYNLLDQSFISILGYSFKEEKIKDEIISKLPHLEIKEIDSSFSFKSIIRDIKLNSILNDNKLEFDENTKWLILDINNILSSKDYLSKPILIKNIVYNLNQELVKLGKFKLLITAKMYRNINDNNINFFGGLATLHMSDVIFLIETEFINVLKNRFDENVKISFDGLSNYQYICEK